MMKKIITILITLVTVTLTSNAQDTMMPHKKDASPKVIALEQTKGAFTQKELTLNAGTYIFEVSNNNAAEKVGLVLVPKGKDVSDPKNHIASAYVTQAVARGKTESTQATTLTKGQYLYFCPLNPTPQHTLTVE